MKANEATKKSTTSQRQVDANRRNALQSTGPSSEDSKLRTSRNAVKHSAYADGAVAISAGPFYEDQDDLDAKIQALADSLYPRDAIERQVAIRVGTIAHKIDRLDAIEGRLLISRTRLTKEQKELADLEDGLTDLEPQLHAFVDWYSSGMPATTMKRSAVLANVARFFNGDRTIPESIRKYFVGEAATDDSQAGLALKAMIDHYFNGDSNKIPAWLDAQLQVAEEGRTHTGKIDEQIAEGLLESLEQLCGLNARLGSELSRALAQYHLLRDRPLFEYRYEVRTGHPYVEHFEERGGQSLDESDG